MISSIKKIDIDYNLNDKKITNPVSHEVKTGTLDNEIVTLETDKINNLDYSVITDNSYTVQGYTNIDGKMLITAYDGRAIKDDMTSRNSRIYIFDQKTGEYVGNIVLNNKNHVGGVTYDTENGILFVTGHNGKVESYNYKLLMDAFDRVKNNTNLTPSLHLDFDNMSESERQIAEKNLENIIIPNNIEIKKMVSEGKDFFHKQDGMDSIYYHNGKLYSCTYSKNGELLETSYKIEKDKNGEIIRINDGRNHEGTKIIGNVGPAVQGLSFYSDNNKNYLITASSGMISASLLSKYEITENGINLVGSKPIPRKGLEGIYIDDYGNISGIYEFDDIVTELDNDKNNSDFQLGNINDINEVKDTYVHEFTGQHGEKINANIDIRKSLEFQGEFWDIKDSIKDFNK